MTLPSKIFLVSFILLAAVPTWSQGLHREGEDLTDCFVVKQLAWLDEESHNDAREIFENEQLPHLSDSQEWSNRRKHLEQFRMLKLLELLDLDEDQEVTFITSFRNLRRQQEELVQRRRKLAKELTNLVHSDKSDDARLEQLMTDLFQLERERISLMENFIKDNKSELTVEQRVKLLLFHENFERDLLRKVEGFRRQQRRGKG